MSSSLSPPLPLSYPLSAPPPTYLPTYLSPSLSLALSAVNKISPRNSLVPDQAPTPSDVLHAQTIETPTPSSHQRSAGHDKIDPFKPPIRSGACRVCLKSFKADDFSITCYECQQRVCEDCASYSKLDVNEDMVGITINVYNNTKKKKKYGLNAVSHREHSSVVIEIISVS